MRRFAFALYDTGTFDYALRSLHPLSTAAHARKTNIIVCWEADGPGRALPSPPPPPSAPRLEATARRPAPNENKPNPLWSSWGLSRTSRGKVRKPHSCDFHTAILMFFGPYTFSQKGTLVLRAPATRTRATPRRTPTIHPPTKPPDPSPDPPRTHTLRARARPPLTHVLPPLPPPRL
jgi:hypothetical protein